MYPLGAEYADVLCPNCRRVMVELARYAAVAGADGGVVDDTMPAYDLRGGGGGGIWEIFAVIGLLGIVFDFLAGGLRRRKVERLCATILPNSPKSLICPACLYVLRRA